MSHLSGIHSLLERIIGNHRPASPSTRFERKLRLEALEGRLPLAAELEVVAPTETPEPPAIESVEETTMPAASERAEIESIVLDINGRERVYKVSERKLFVQAGDTVQLKAINYMVNQEAMNLEGVVAAEGYLRRNGEWAYNDGRFGDNREPFQASNEVIEINGEWTADVGDDRMSIVALHYHGDNIDVLDRFFVQVKVIPTDLFLYNIGRTISGLRGLQVGREATFDTAWGTTSSKPMQNELVVNVYHTSSSSQPEWTGRLEGEAVLKSIVSGQATDSEGRGWTPQRSGYYTVEISLDPNNEVTEFSERNNRAVFRVQVRDAGKSSSRDSLFSGDDDFWRS